MKPKVWIGAGFVLVVGIAFVVSRVVGSGSRAASTIPMSRTDETMLDPQDPRTELADLPLDAPDRGRDVDVRLEVAPPTSAPSLEIPPDAAHIRVTVRSHSDATALSWITVLARPASFDAATSTVESKRSSGVAFERLRSATDGTVEFAVTPDVPFVVHAFGRDRGYDMQEASVPALAPNQTVDVVLELNATEASSYWMRLIDEHTRRPIAATEVVIENAGSPKRITDAEGLVACPLDDPRTTSIEVAGYGRRVISRTPGHESPRDALGLELARSATLHVHALAPDGRPLADLNLRLISDRDLPAWVSKQDSWFVAPRFLSWSTRTDAQGRATFHNLTPNISFTAASDEFPEFQTEAPLRFAPGEDRSATWTLGGACTLRVRVVDQLARPIVGCDLWLTRPVQGRAWDGVSNVRSQRTAHTDDRGECSFDGLPSGTWLLLSPSSESSEDEGGTGSASDVGAWHEIVTIPVGATDAEVIVRADRGLTIKGTVFDASGKPVAGKRVCAVSAARHDHKATVTRGDGSFRLSPVSRAEYVLYAEGDDREVRSPDVRVLAPARDVELGLRRGERLTVRLLGSVGEQENVQVRVFPRAPDARNVAHSWQRVGDTIDVAAQLEGEYVVTASTESGFVGGTSPIPLRPGTPQSVEVSMARGGWVRVLGEVEGEDTWVEAVVRGAVYDRVNLLPGLEVSLHAPVGAVMIRVTSVDADRHAVERVVDVQANETTDFVIPAGSR